MASDWVIGLLDSAIQQAERLADKAWCPTGIGNGQDNSCPPKRSAGGGSAVAERLQDEHDLTEEQAKWAAEAIPVLEEQFKEPARSAAVNEILTAAKYPGYLAGILAEAEVGLSEIEAVLAWGARRGRMWEVN